MGYGAAVMRHDDDGGVSATCLLIKPKYECVADGAAMAA
jgi:hypothetical protein